jgi:WD40 repeat protein
VAFAADGKTLATAGWDGTVRLWDTASGQERRRFPGPVTGLEAVAFAADGRTLAAGGQDGTVRLWDARTGNEAGPPGRNDNAVRSLAFAPDGKTVVTSGGDGIRLWEAATGRLVRHVPADGWTTVLGPAPDGRLLCGSGDKDLRVWDALTGKDVRHLAGKSSGSLTAVAAADDGRLLVTHGIDRLTRLWRVADGPRELLNLSGDTVLVDALSPDGKLFAAAGRARNGIQIWQTTTGKPERLIALGTNAVLALAFSGESKYLAAGGQAAPEANPALQNVPGMGADQALGALNLWRTGDGKLARRFPVARGTRDNRFVGCVEFAPDGRSLATGEGSRTGLVTVYEVATGKVRRQLPGHLDAVTAVAFSADGSRLVSGSLDLTALVWDLGGRAELAGRALTADELQSLWSDLADEDAAKAYRALRLLAAAPRQAVPFLKEHLKPAPVPVPAGRLEKLLADLDSERFVVRSQANTDLEALGELAEAALQKALAQSPSLEKKRRVEALLAKLAQPWTRFRPAPQLRQLRAVEALERAGGPDAEALLRELSRGAPDAWLTQEAQASLRRLARRSARP